VYLTSAQAAEDGLPGLNALLVIIILVRVVIGLVNLDLSQIA